MLGSINEPNPFNPSTNISFNISNDYTKQNIGFSIDYNDGEGDLYKKRFIFSLSNEIIDEVT